MLAPSPTPIDNLEEVGAEQGEVQAAPRTSNVDAAHVDTMHGGASAASGIQRRPGGRR
jgi:hypothetical protein